jgi:GntR family transcriptional regulator
MSKSRYSRPLRYQIRKDILDFILDKGYKPGDQIPSEQELSDLLEVSRFSLREAIHLLEEERVISTKHGTGRFLLSTPGDLNIDLTNLQGVTELLMAYHIRSINKVLSVERQPAGADYAQLFNVTSASPIVVINRLRFAENIPIIYSIDAIPETILPGGWGEADFEGSLFSYLQSNCGIAVSHSQTTVRSVLLDPEKTPFQHDYSRPWILLEQVIYSQKDEPVMVSKDYHRGDYISFNIRRFRR